MKLTQAQIDHFNREGWLFLPELFSQEEVDFLAREAVAIYDANRPEVWREKSGAPRTAFAAHLYSEPFAHPRRASAHDRADRADLRRKGLHAPVQDQRQSRLRRRRLAMAPGLRHLETRRRHARAARDERRDLPRRGEADQRPADVRAEEPARRRPRGRARPRDHELSAVDARRGNRDAAGRSRAASSRQPASPAAC